MLPTSVLLRTLPQITASSFEYQPSVSHFTLNEHPTICIWAYKVVNNVWVPRSTQQQLFLQRPTIPTKLPDHADFLVANLLLLVSVKIPPSLPRIPPRSEFLHDGSSSRLVESTLDNVQEPSSSCLLATNSQDFNVATARR